MSCITRTEIASGAFCSYINSDKFKTCRVSATMLLPLKKETAAALAILPRLLTRSCKIYPDFINLNKQLDKLYGVGLYSHSRKMGDTLALTISMSFLDERYALNGEKISDKLIELLQEIIFNPNVTSGAFNENDVNIEKSQLLDAIDSEYNDKRIYAINKMLEKMCEQELFGTKYYGSYKQVEALTPHGIYNAWEYALKCARFEFIAIGNEELFNSVQNFKKAFINIERTPEKLSTSVISKISAVKEFEESMELSQSKLVMGFRTPYAEPSDTYAARLTADILGGCVTSKFFTNIREKQSLCYYCAARFNRNKGIFVVDSGVESKNIEITRNEILKNIKSLQNGDLTDFELESAKLSMINNFNMMSDTTSDIEAWYLAQIYADKMLTPYEASKKIEEITAQQVIESAGNFVLDTVFALKGN